MIPAYGVYNVFRECDMGDDDYARSAREVVDKIGYNVLNTSQECDETVSLVVSIHASICDYVNRVCRLCD